MLGMTPHRHFLTVVFFCMFNRTTILYTTITNRRKPSSRYNRAFVKHIVHTQCIHVHCITTKLLYCAVGLPELLLSIGHSTPAVLVTINNNEDQKRRESLVVLFLGKPFVVWFLRWPLKSQLHLGANGSLLWTIGRETKRIASTVCPGGGWGCAVAHTGMTVL